MKGWWRTVVSGVGRTIVRFLRLLKLYTRLDFLLMTRDMKTFMTWAISDAVLNVATVSGMVLLAQRFEGIGIWSKYQFFFLIGYAALADGLLGTLFGYNISAISRRIGRGQLDHTLIQPQGLALSLLTEGFSPAFGIPTLLPGIGLMVFAAQHLSLPYSVFWWFAFACNMLGSVAVAIAFQFIWGTLAFFAPRAAEEINSGTDALRAQLKSFPLDGVGPMLLGGLMTILPVGFIAWLPCRALLGISSHRLALWFTPLASIGFVLLMVWVFSKGLKHYGRVGSQRYSSFGHRC